MYSYLKPDNLKSIFKDSKEYTDGLTKSFSEFERIARNRPHDKRSKELPSVTDGTTASIVQKTPKRIVQQVPTGVVEADDSNDWLDIIAQDVYEHKILPHANQDYSLFEKAHLMIENGLTFGISTSYATFTNHDGLFIPDMVIPYWGDVFFQRGKKSARSSEYVFLRSWWQPSDIDALIDSEERLAKQAKERGDKYEGTWNVANLKEIRDQKTDKDPQAITPHEDEKSTKSDAIELVTAFQKGIKAKFYTFHPGTGTVVRTKVNKDPRGAIPLDFFYGDIDGANPLGRGIIELIGGLQNLIDSDMQMYQWNRAYSMAPALQVYGNIPLSNVRLAPNQLIKMSDPTGKIVPLTVDTRSLDNYPALYGLQKSQLLNLVNSPDTSISADVGNPGFSKTPAGINQQQATISVDDNAVRKRFESWWESCSETLINLYFAERTGIEKLRLSDKAAEKIRALITDGKLPQDFINEKNEVLIDYDTATPALHFRIDASTSKIKNDADSLGQLVNLLEIISNSPVLMQTVPQEKILGIYNSIVSVSGVEDPEKLSVDLDEFMAEQQAMQPPQQGQPMQPEQPPIDPATEQLVMELRALGLPDHLIAQAVQMAEQGFSEGEIIQALTQGATNG